MTLSSLSIWRRKEFVLSWMSVGICHGLGIHLELTWSFGLKISSEVMGLPAKYTFVWKSLVKREKESGIFLLGRRGTGMNFNPSPMMFLREPGTWVCGRVRSCMVILDGREW